MEYSLKYKVATQNDAAVLAELNKQLTEDELHKNRFQNQEWFSNRMTQFLKEGYEAIIFENQNIIIGYALYRNHFEQKDTIYLRQIFVDRKYRKQGFGKQMMEILNKKIWPEGKRITVEVLHHNEIAKKFYRNIGFKDYSLELELKR